MSTTVDSAQAIIGAALSHPDPEGAMEKLEAEASADDKRKFPGLWEALVLQLNQAPL